MVSSKNPAFYANFTAPSTADTTQFFQTDDNIAVETLPGIIPNVAFDAGNHNITSMFHVIPLTNVSSTVTAPNDGFFTPVSYRGAFDGSKEGQWLSDWALLEIQTQFENNPTDLNHDGKTDINDYLIFSGRFGYPNI